MTNTPIVRIRKGFRLVAAALSVAAMPALAQGPGWTEVSTVIELVNTSNGGVNVRLSPDVTGCTSQSGYGSLFASIYPNHPGISRLKADLLVALTTGARASIYPNHPGISRLKADLLVALTTGARVSLYLGDNTCMVAEMRLYPPG